MDDNIYMSLLKADVPRGQPLWLLFDADVAGLKDFKLLTMCKACNLLLYICWQLLSSIVRVFLVRSW